MKRPSCVRLDEAEKQNQAVSAQRDQLQQDLKTLSAYSRRRTSKESFAKPITLNSMA